ncbi:DUF6259 domain-containing protein [Candidatus Hydrogenedentota bacterium]
MLFPITNPVPCYGKDHPHPMGYGRWFGEGWKELCRRAREVGRATRPDMVFSAEEMCEIYIPYFETCLTREERRSKAIYDNEAMGTLSGKAPIFPYVYHDYMTGIGDFAEPCSLGDPRAPIAIAKQFARAKHIGVLIPNKALETTGTTVKDAKFVLDAVNTLYELGASNTLLARMIKPPKIRALIPSGKPAAGPPVDWRTSRPALGAYESSNGVRALLLSNSGDQDVLVGIGPIGKGYRPIRLTINGQSTSVEGDGDGGFSKLTIPARSSIGIVYEK